MKLNMDVVKRAERQLEEASAALEGMAEGDAPNRAYLHTLCQLGLLQLRVSLMLLQALARAEEDRHG